MRGVARSSPTVGPTSVRCTSYCAACTTVTEMIEG